MNQIDIPTQVNEIAGLVHAGQLDLAKRQTRRTLADADPHVLEVLANCVDILQAPPKIALPKLRHYWKVCGSQADRAIIAACAPEEGAARGVEREQGCAPRQTQDALYRAPRDIRTEIRPELRRRPDPRQAQHADARKRAYKDADAYEAERSTEDERPEQADRPVGYAIDYDFAALPALRGTPCVRCWTERCSADQVGRHDDGLCVDCRERGRSGIPALPDGHTTADAIAARCASIAEHNPPSVARRVLQREWRRAHVAEHRTAIADWVAAHLGQAESSEPGTTSHAAGTCKSCGSFRAVHRRLCDDCAAAATSESLLTSSVAVPGPDSGQAAA